jgi:hypothetical protein
MNKYNVRSLITKGAAHPLRCEDDFLVKETDCAIMACVFDGCSSGIDSHVASSIHKKLISDSSSFSNTGPNDAPSEVAKIVLESLYEDLFYYQDYTAFEINKEMLSTVIILIVNKLTSNFSIVVAGDGVVNINDAYFNIHDKEGESVYYLSSILENHDSIPRNAIFEEYYNKHCTTFTGESFNSIAISTDGIDTFKTKYGRMLGEAPRDFFMKNRAFEKAPNQLKRLYNIYTQGLHLEDRTPSINQDDFTMIKITHGTT